MAKEHSFIPDTINLIADQCEVLIKLEAKNELAKDAAFRIEQIVELAASFMRRANRSKLTCDDINRSLKWLNCPPLYGYSCKPASDLSYSYLKAANVYVYDEHIVDLEQCTLIEDAANTQSPSTSQTKTEQSPHNLQCNNHEQIIVPKLSVRFIN